jgi:uncharacterized protein (DUF58 family)
MSDHSIPLPYTLDKKRLKIRPTRYGMVFILLLLGMFAGSVNYNNNLGFLLTFLLGSIAFVSIAQTYKNITGIRIFAGKTRPVFAGEEAAFEFVAEDTGVNRFSIGFVLSGGDSAILDIMRGSANRIDVKVPASSRGLLRPWPMTVYTEYPLGLFRVHSQIEPDLECIVYPKPEIGTVKTTAEKSGAEMDGGLTGSGTDDFQGLKGYRPGDPLQRISWKASSRGRGLFTKDFNGLYGASFYLDWHRLKGLDSERRLSILCHAVLKANLKHLNFGLILPGKKIEPGSGEIHKNRCLKTLALFDVGSLHSPA